MACLVVEIGNTALKAALTDGITIGKTYRYQGENSIDYVIYLVEKEKPEMLTIASVYCLSAEDRGKLSLFCENVFVVDRGDEVLYNNFGIPSYISVDRAAAVVAAKEMFSNKACTVFDFGTIISIDFIDSEGHYAGGNVSPGCRTRFKSINRYSKALPLIDTPQEYPQIGFSIEESIQSGVVSGIVFEMEAYMKQYPDNVVVFTGGDSVYFAKRMKNSIFVVCNLVLMGLAIISERYVKKKS